MEKIRLGISACLLGEPVRHDGSHRLDRYVRDTLGLYFDYVPVCPEVECGLPVPREPMRLVGDPESPRLITRQTGKDLTGLMQGWAREKLDALARLDLCGFIFKSNSPSSGMEHVRVYSDKGVPRKIGRGIFAAAFLARFPLVPAEDEGRLHDPGIRENFIERVFTLKRWRETAAREKKTSRLVDFHARHKLLLMAHSPRHLSMLGKLVASADAISPDRLYREYENGLMEALKLKATVRKNTNVLEHMAGYFKKVLSGDEKAEVGELISRYHAGHVPLIVPVTLIAHYVRKYGQAYLKEQVYLNPHPIDLRLRNHC